MNAITGGPTGGQLAENGIITWLRAHPRYLAKAISLADGDEFEYGDDDLAEWFLGLLDDRDQRLLGTDTGWSLGDVAATENADFDRVDWSVVRAVILEEGEKPS